MKIYIDGGKRAAVTRMFPVWERLGHEIVNNQRCADVQMSTVTITRKIIPTVLRLDGIYYDKADNYKGRNIEISKAHSIADAVVYQSNLSRRMCEKYLTKRKTQVYDVIHNGIDGLEWDNKKEHSGFNIVSCSKWRRVKRLPEIVEIFNDFLTKYPESKLHIIGPMFSGSSEIMNKNTIYYGNIDFEKMKQIYSEMDMFLHLCKKDSCPSTVVEAIASGIPVVTTNACGGATEMCKITNGCVIIEGETGSLEPDYIYKDKYNKISREVKDSIVEHMLEITSSKTRVKLPHELMIDNVAEKYIDIMEKCLMTRRHNYV